MITTKFLYTRAEALKAIYQNTYSEVQASDGQDLACTTAYQVKSFYQRQSNAVLTGAMADLKHGGNEDLCTVVEN